MKKGNRTVKPVTTVVGGLLVLVLLLLPLGSCGGGKNIGQALDDLEGKIQSTAGGLGSTANLTELAMLDTLLMKVKELREQWKDILGESIDKLDLEQQKTLDTISQATGKVHGILDHVTQIQDYAVLDLNVLLAKVGLANNNQIRRIQPAAQVFKDSGLYTYRVTLPLFGSGNHITSISIGGVDVTSWKRDDPPHSIILDVPVKALDKLFDSWELKRPELKIHLQGENTWWQFWKKTPETDVVLHTGAFPRTPLRYWFAEHPHHSEIDATQLAEVSSPPTLIPGCGNSGCYLSYDVCAVAPVGSAPTGEILETHDSFSGWGTFLPPPRVTTNLTCMLYQQHSHNQNRTVWFKTRFHPLKDVEETHYYTLQPLIVSGDTPNEPGNPSHGSPAGNLSAISQSASKLVLLGGLVSVSASVNTQGSGPVANPTYYPPNGDFGPTPRPLALGMTYEVPIGSSDLNWELVVQPFTGDPIVLSPTKLSQTMVTVRRETNRLMVDTRSPF